MPTIKVPRRPALSRNRVDADAVRRLRNRNVRKLHAAVDLAVDAALRRALRPITLKLEKPTLMVTAAAKTSPEAFLSVDDAGYIRTTWREEVKDLMSLMEQSYLAGGMSTARSVGGAFLTDLFSPAAERYLAEAENRLVGVGDALWTGVRDQLLEGFREGESMAKLRDRVSDVAGFTSARATNVARTEVIAASNAGGFNEAREQGVLFKTWLATNDDRTRPTHVDVDGMTVGIDEWFDVGGWSAQHPGDSNLPPEEAINCRCTLTWAENADGDAVDYCACTPDFEALTAADDGETSEFDCSCLNSEDEMPSSANVALDEALAQEHEFETQSAIDAYAGERGDVTEAAAYDINSALRGDIEMTPQLQSYIRGMDEGFRSSATELREETVVYRALDSDTARMFMNDVVSDGYSSTTMSIDIARSYAEGNAMLEINLMPGTRVLAGSPSEMELILNRGATFIPMSSYVDAASGLPVYSVILG